MITFCKSYKSLFWSTSFFTRHWKTPCVKEWFWTWYPNSCNVFLASFSRPIQGPTNNFEREIVQHDVWCQKQGFINFQRIWLLFVLANQNVGNQVSFMWINAQIKKELFRRINVHFNLSMHLVSQTSKTIVKYVITSIGKHQKALLTYIWHITPNRKRS